MDWHSEADECSQCAELREKLSLAEANAEAKENNKQRCYRRLAALERKLALAVDLLQEIWDTATIDGTGGYRVTYEQFKLVSDTLAGIDPK